jgi:hypothetical protein
MWSLTSPLARRISIADFPNDRFARQWLLFRESQFLTDTVENVENRTAPKISRKLLWKLPLPVSDGLQYWTELYAKIVQQMQLCARAVRQRRRPDLPRGGRPTNVKSSNQHVGHRETFSRWRPRSVLQPGRCRTAIERFGPGWERSDSGEPFWILATGQRKSRIGGFPEAAERALSLALYLIFAASFCKRTVRHHEPCQDRRNQF